MKALHSVSEVTYCNCKVRVCVVCVSQKDMTVAEGQ